jgi:hypothetical protein
MTRQVINTGVVENDKSGDKVREAFVKINNMTSDIYSTFGNGTSLVSVSSGVAVTGTPVANQLAIWSTNSVIEGDTDLTWNGTTLSVTGNITVTGTVSSRDIATDGSKLDGIEDNATADMTASEIKTAYESNADTNAFTDADQSKLAGIEAGAQRSVPEIVSVTTSRALALTDERDILEVDTTGGAVAITIPTNAAVAFPIGTIINITLVDITAAATLVADTGVTLNGVSAGTETIVSALYSHVTLYKRGADAWVVYGDVV